MSLKRNKTNNREILNFMNITQRQEPERKKQSSHNLKAPFQGFATGAK